MTKLEEARKVLSIIGMPKKQQSDVCCYTLLAMANLKEKSNWSEANNSWIRIHDIIQFSNNNYNTSYAENSRETFRKQALHHFRNAAIVEDNEKPTNSPNYSYRITREFLNLLHSFNTLDWHEKLSIFKHNYEDLVDLYSSKKKMSFIPIKINNLIKEFSSGKHNELQKEIIENFAPRFAQNSECIYIGDTVKKDLIRNEKKLKDLGFSMTLHDKMPDVILYSEKKNWIYFIEAVTSVGPMSPKRVIEIEEMTKNTKIGKIYVTAFLDFNTYKKFSSELAWETEVWIAENPEHMIHLNGDKFLGPRKRNNYYGN